MKNKLRGEGNDLRPRLNTLLSAFFSKYEHFILIKHSTSFNFQIPHHSLSYSFVSSIFCLFNS